MMRSVVVLPQPEGPRRHTVSPAATCRSTSRTAASDPKTLVTRLSSMVDMEPASSLDRAEGDAAQEMFLQDEGDDDHRDEEQSLDGRKQAPADADVAADRLRHGDRHRAGLDAGEEEREEELVPGQDEAEHG